MMYGVEFKAEVGSSEYVAIKEQWDNYIDNRFRAMLLDLGYWTMLQFNKPIVVTCLNRTEEQNTLLGGVTWSSHLFGRGGDLRSWTFTEDEIKQIDAYLIDTWGEEYVFVKYHDSGSGKHIHTNIRYKHNRGNFALPYRR